MKHLAIFLLLWSGCGAAARAETDYRCLASCTGAGKNSAFCMEQCRYGQPAFPASGAKREYSPRQFDAPVPTDKLLLPKKSAGEKPPEKNHTCLSRCLKEGMQYRFCEKNCARAEKKGYGRKATSTPGGGVSAK